MDTEHSMQYTFKRSSLCFSQNRLLGKVNMISVRGIERCFDLEPLCKKVKHVSQYCSLHVVHACVAWDEQISQFISMVLIRWI